MDGQSSSKPFYPWSENPLRNRQDVENALQSLIRPIQSYRSQGGARIEIGSAAAHFAPSVAGMEGFSRLLWGLVPAQVGGADWIDWHPIRCGLVNGSNPEHPEYWGDPAACSQHLVELAAIGFALRLVPEYIWQPLDPDEKRIVADYLRKGHSCEHVDNNWKFFPQLVNMGLRHIGENCDPERNRKYAEDIERFYIGQGWYRDGNTNRIDHYLPFGFHYYGLVLAALDGGEYAGRYRERARLIASDMAHWFSQDGAALCFGRSQTYRFAILGFFGALALADEAGLGWGRLKGLYLRGLRWWAEKPFAGRDHVLEVGFGYSNLLMSETYNSPQSPYWALKAFLPLMLPETHPFWAAEEEPWPQTAKSLVQKSPGFIINAPAGDCVALSSGQQANDSFIRTGPEKYAKFAYSARYGFNIETGGYGDVISDNMLALSIDGKNFRVRDGNETAMIADDVLYSVWRPFENVKISTWLYWDGDFHIRIHEICTDCDLTTIEGGFAIPRNHEENTIATKGRGIVSTSRDFSAIIDLAGGVSRNGNCHIAAPNSNLIHPQTVVPQLRGSVPTGVSLLAAAVLVTNNPQQGTDLLEYPLVMRDIRILKSLMKMHGTPVSVAAKTL